MANKICYYCGTEYPAEAPCCPLCEQTEVEPEAVDEIPAELEVEMIDEKDAILEAKKAKKAKRGNVISTVVCVLLAVAIVAGALFILNTLGVISFEKEPADETTLTLPVEQQTPVEVLCTGIDLTPSNAAFNAVGSTVNLIVTVEPAGCTEALAFQSADESVATVTENGIVTAVGNGTTEITVSCGQFAKSMDVVCTIAEETPEDVPETGEVDLSSLALSVEDFTLFAPGETAQISIDGLPENVEVTWSSSDETVAVVKDGKVTGTGGGTATITAMVADVKLSCIVRSKFEGTFVPETTDETSEDAPFIFPEDVTITVQETFVVRLVENDARIQGVSWRSANEQICTVAADGTVVGIAPGVTEITGTYNGQEYTCIVRCK